MTDVTQYDSVIKTALRKKRVRKDQREDMSQECYVALLERKEELDPELAGKICRTRIETILREQEQKRTKKENKIRFVSADLPSVSRLLSKIAWEKEGPISESELYQAIDSLDESLREVIQTVYIVGLTQPAAAEKLGIPLITLRRRISRGIMDLRLTLGVED
jgi:RNA polymerase sigma factor (sigma-70 family)